MVKTQKQFLTPAIVLLTALLGLSTQSALGDPLAENAAETQPGAAPAAAIGLSKARSEFWKACGIPTGVDSVRIDSIFAAVLAREAFEPFLGRRFVDSLSMTVAAMPPGARQLTPELLDDIGSQAWAGLKIAVPYPKGFAAEFVAELESNANEREGTGLAPILFSLIIILLAAKFGGDLVERVKQPAVLGELIFGVILGNVALLGFNGFETLKHHITIEILAEIGVILLLFEVGLESKLREMLSVGLTSFFIASIGVILPFFLGWGVSALFFPEESIFIHIFVGATLTATSVGITARVLKDMGKVRTREGRIILGAAVIDDILGLVVLAVVVGIIAAHNTGGQLSSLKILWIITKAFLFIFGAVILGTAVAPHLFKVVSRLRAQSVLITFALMFCFLFALVADRIGLAPIVGAFAAGMILSDVNFKDIFRHEERSLDELLAPISAFLVPIFFVYMGLHVDLSTLGTPEVIFFALVLTLAAIVGKQACSLGAVFERKVNPWVLGVGMIPRGEVGLIFAGIGAKLVVDGQRVVNPDAYSAVIIMVMVTTLVTPPLLKLLFSEH